MNEEEYEKLMHKARCKLNLLQGWQLREYSELVREIDKPDWEHGRLLYMLGREHGASSAGLSHAYITEDMADFYKNQEVKDEE